MSIMIATQNIMRKVALQKIPLTKSTIFELGCSDGNFASLLVDRYSEYTGADILKHKIDIARTRFPKMKFLQINICNNLDILKCVNVFISFQALEHIPCDLKIFESLLKGTIVIFSVPNSPYKDQHLRWFEIEGWKERYSSFIDFDYELTIQHPKKEAKRAFLFKGVRI